MTKSTVSNTRVVTKERKVTIPESMGLKHNDAVEISLTENGNVLLRKLIVNK